MYSRFTPHHCHHQTRRYTAFSLVYLFFSSPTVRFARRASSMWTNTKKEKSTVTALTAAMASLLRFLTWNPDHRRRCPGNHNNWTHQLTLEIPCPSNIKHMFDGHGMTKATEFLDDSASEIVSDLAHEAQGPGGASTLSLTPSLRAAAPLATLTPSRRISLPGAFRMSRGGAISPNDNTEVGEDPSQASESVGFFTHNAHEAPIEATLVCDRPFAMEDQRPSPPRESTASVTTNLAGDAELVAEAKPLHGFFLCDCWAIGRPFASSFFLLLPLLALQQS